jgi:hypothetical protein
MGQLSVCIVPTYANGVKIRCNLPLSSSGKCPVHGKVR